jgi:dienelactone hydrolase
MKENIQLANGLEGVLYLPKNGPGKAAVIILHERYGLVQHTLDLAQKLADDGYVAFAPNLFSQWDGDKAALTAGTARVIMPDPEITRVIGLAIALLRGDNRVNAAKIFLMGVCQSGRYPIVVGSQRDDIAACVVFYGASQGRDWEVGKLQPVSMPDMVAKLTVPSLFVFGGRPYDFAGSCAADARCAGNASQELPHARYQGCAAWLFERYDARPLPSLRYRSGVENAVDLHGRSGRG